MHAALLGLSHPHSAVLLSTLENLPEITRVHLWDDDPVVVQQSDLATRPKVASTSSDLDQILAEPGLHFAIVCARHDKAAAVSHRVVAAGKHLLAEKPVGLNPREIATLAEAVARAGVVASVLYLRRAHPCMQFARRVISAGTIGPLISVECRFITTQVQFRDPGHWLFRRAESGGGILLWLGCHFLDLMQHVTGDEVTTVSAFLATRSPEKIDVEDTAVLALQFRSGALGSFHAAHALAFSGSGYTNARGYDAYLAFHGLGGRVVWPNMQPRITLESKPSSPAESPVREESFILPPSTSYGGSLGEDFVRQFLTAIQGRGAPPTTLADALRTASVIEAAERSARTGSAVTVTALH